MIYLERKKTWRVVTSSCPFGRMVNWACKRSWRRRGKICERRDKALSCNPEVSRSNKFKSGVVDAFSRNDYTGLDQKKTKIIFKKGNQNIRKEKTNKQEDKNERKEKEKKKKRLNIDIIYSQ
jgi:hypothetical protein